MMHFAIVVTGLCMLSLPLQGATHEIWVSASAHIAGGFESNWRTDVHIFNGGSQTSAVSVYFLQSGTDYSAANLARPPKTVEVPAGGQVKIGDILASLFGLTSASGSLLFASDQAIQVVSRTYNKLEKGEYGQFIAGVPASRALAQGRLVGAVGTGGFRTNLGFVNTSRTAAATITLAFLNGQGTVLTEATRTLPPFVHIQYNDLFATFGLAPQDPVTVIYTSSIPVLGYLSVADNITNDPIYVPGLP